MAIGFARVEFVKRSSGKTACAKAAYNSRSRIEFQGNSIMESTVFDWSDKGSCFYHEVLLPKSAHEKFKNTELLWNHVESKEIKKNAQVAMELVLALPDDKSINLEDRIHLAKSFIQTHFVDKGLAAQLDVHEPERRILITRNDKESGLIKGMNLEIVSEKAGILLTKLESGKEIEINSSVFSGFIEKDNNWHAHVLLTTRRFQENGLDLEDHKARDLMPRIVNGVVISGENWGKLWTEHQNRYFQEKGLDLRVDPNGMVGQLHLGPRRMRGRAFDLFMENGRLMEENQHQSKDPHKILKIITQRKSVFSQEDFEQYVQKHLSPELINGVRDAFWKQADLVPLLNKQTGELLNKYTSQEVLKEERSILRIATRINSSNALNVTSDYQQESEKPLNEEQKVAFNGILKGSRLACVQGYAGTGKSFLLSALNSAYTREGFKVRAFGPDNATSNLLKNKGFENSENIYRFLFSLHHGKRDISKGKEIWILDEAGKLGNQPLLEFLREAESRKVQVVLAGDYAQLPPVARGGMFKVFCEQFPCFTLQQIQRQKDVQQRDVALSLAKGDMGGALDQLSSLSKLKWSKTKVEAIEQLVTQWTEDTARNPGVSTLLIAHTNDEVRVLNEMVRAVRKERGELGEKEFSCQTTFGIIYVSQGDRIEFRSKNGDIGVTNGLSGTLVEANEDSFVVSIKESNGKQRVVSFNPKEYSSYQLGYASTWFRSQGSTIQKAYVLHSPYLNKQMFYVGLTRHVEEVYYYVSKDLAYCLSDLKRQSLREGGKETTLAYASQQDIKKQKNDTEIGQKIQNLKHSESFIDRMKGFGVSAYQITKEKASGLKERFQDTLPSRDFFTVEKPAQLPTAEVKLAEHPQVLDPIVSSKQITKEHFSAGLNSYSIEKERPRFSSLSFFQKMQESRAESWGDFSSEQQSALKDYFSASAKADSLHAVVEIETQDGEKDIRSVHHFQDWQEACGHRNERAFFVKQSIPAGNLMEFLGKNSSQFIESQSNKYEAFLNKKEANSISSTEDLLQQHVEPLLYQLFPGGPSRKTRTEFRFGNKGSLAVHVSGERAGQYYDFERQEGGSIFKLVQRELGFGRLEALEWSKRFLGESDFVQTPKSFLKPSKAQKEDVEWVSLRPDLQKPAPKLEAVGGKGLHYYFNELARHAYKDESGNLLYYVLRLQKKDNPSEKFTPPLSFGYWKANPNEPGWALKGFHAEQNALYNLPALRENPTAKILIVEGEKTADLALNKFPNENLICLSWPKGAKAVKLADWLPLINRRVMIWPDNDKAGYEAGRDICQELRKIGVQSLQVVDENSLRKHFPEKWDLADPNPEGVKTEFLKQLLLAAPHKGLDPVQVLYRVSGSKEDVVERARANEVLWRVDERMRPDLEKKYGANHTKIHAEILSETAKILIQRGEIEKRVGELGSASPEFLQRVSYQACLFTAANGKNPSESELDEIRNKIRDISCQFTNIGKQKNIADFCVDKGLAAVCEQSYVVKGSDRGLMLKEMHRAEDLVGRLALGSDFPSSSGRAAQYLIKGIDFSSGPQM